jgi:hypothetical protein
MTTVNIEPTKDHPVPFDDSDEKTATYLDEITVAANTAEVQVALGAPLEVDPDNLDREKALIEAATKRKKSGALKNVNTAFAAGAFLRTYGQQAALDVATARSAITNKLMEIANCGDPRYELKALELLGKHSDIGLFTERSEITINYKDPQDLENAIKDRIKRLLNADVTDVTPIGADLDEELGVADVQGEDEETEETQSEDQDVVQAQVDEEEDGDPKPA